jgi:hypothetical protein
MRWSSPATRRAQEARAQAEAEASHESLVPEETLAYLIQNHPEMSFVQKIISAIKTWVYRNFGIGASTLTQDDLAALARAAVLHSASIEGLPGHLDRGAARMAPDRQGGSHAP